MPDKEPTTAETMSHEEFTDEVDAIIRSKYRDPGSPTYELTLSSDDKVNAARQLMDLPTDEPFLYGADHEGIEMGIELSREALLRFVVGWPDAKPRPGTETVLVLQKQRFSTAWNVAIFSQMEGPFDKSNAEWRCEQETQRLMNCRDRQEG